MIDEHLLAEMETALFLLRPRDRVCTIPDVGRAKKDRSDPGAINKACSLLDVRSATRDVQQHDKSHLGKGVLGVMSSASGGCDIVDIAPSPSTIGAWRSRLAACADRPRSRTRLAAGYGPCKDDCRHEAHIVLPGRVVKTVMERICATLGHQIAATASLHRQGMVCSVRFVDHDGPCDIESNARAEGYTAACMVAASGVAASFSSIETVLTATVTRGSQRALGTFVASCVRQSAAVRTRWPCVVRRKPLRVQALVAWAAVTFSGAGATINVDCSRDAAHAWVIPIAPPTCNAFHIVVVVDGAEDGGDACFAIPLSEGLLDVCMDGDPRIVAAERDHRRSRWYSIASAFPRDTLGYTDIDNVGCHRTMHRLWRRTRAVLVRELEEYRMPRRVDIRTANNAAVTVVGLHMYLEGSK